MRFQRKWLTAGGLVLALALAIPAVTAAAARTGAAQSGVIRPALSAALPTLSAQQLAGQRVIYSYSGRTPPASLISLIKHGDRQGDLPREELAVAQVGIIGR